MACINVSLQRINLIKLTHCDETKKRAHDSHSDILLKNTYFIYFVDLTFLVIRKMDFDTHTTELIFLMPRSHNHGLDWSVALRNASLIIRSRLNHTYIVHPYRTTEIGISGVIREVQSVVEPER